MREMKSLKLPIKAGDFTLVMLRQGLVGARVG
jgi:hypothetical protein